MRGTGEACMLLCTCETQYVNRKQEPAATTSWTPLDLHGFLHFRFPSLPFRLYFLPAVAVHQNIPGHPTHTGMPSLQPIIPPGPFIPTSQGPQPTPPPPSYKREANGAQPSQAIRRRGGAPHRRICGARWGVPGAHAVYLGMCVYAHTVQQKGELLGPT